MNCEKRKLEKGSNGETLEQGSDRGRNESRGTGNENRRITQHEKGE